MRGGRCAIERGEVRVFSLLTDRGVPRAAAVYDVLDLGVAELWCDLMPVTEDDELYRALSAAFRALDTPVLFVDAAPWRTVDS
jgi:hypothetical protein